MSYSFLDPKKFINDDIIANATAPMGLAAAMSGNPMAGPVGGAGLFGLKLGNMLGEYVDGLDNYGPDPFTGKKRDAFDVAADIGTDAENWVQGKLGVKEGDGSFGDKLGGFVGGGVSGLMGIGGGLYEGGKSGAKAIMNLFGGQYD